MTPDPTSERTLAAIIRNAREAKGISLGKLADATGISKTRLFNIEQGTATARPPALQALATALDIPLADLYAAAGYPTPTDLPSFTPYLRSKYSGLPPEARAELQEVFQRLSEKYGYDGDGPADGEDEH